MKMSLPLYDALTSISVSGDKATAVVNAWETDVEKLASKSDLLQTETHLKASISELATEVRALNKEQGALIKEQGAELRASIAGLEAQNKIVRWQFGVLFLCISVPAIKLVYDFLNKAFLG